MREARGSAHEGVSLPGRPPARHLGRAAVLLGVSTTTANLLGYAFAIVLSRSLGPADFGALAALLAAGLIGSIPGVALQLAVARSAATGSEAAEVTRWLRIALATGVLLMLATWVLAPIAESYLSLPDPAPVLWLGVVLFPTTLTGAFQGRLLGREQHERLSASYVSVAGLRFVSGAVAAWLGWSIAGALAGAAVASAAALAVTAALAGVPRASGGGAGSAALVRELLGAASSTAAIFVLTNVDIVLARHYLPPGESGHYAVGSLFTKAAFWGPHFLAVLAYPRLARRRARRRALVAALALTVAIGLMAVVGSSLVARRLIEVTAGPDYADIAPLAAAFALLGLLMAVLQLMVYSGLARRHRVTEAVVWFGIVAEVGLVASRFHASPGGILAACIAVNAGVATIVVLRETAAAVSSPRRGRFFTPVPQVDGALVAPPAETGGV